jgi:hypothetical protein
MDGRVVSSGLASPKGAERDGAYLMYSWDGTLFAQAFIPITLQVAGQAVPIVEDVTKDPDRNNSAILDADASRRAALLVACIFPICALLAPGRAGASTPKVAHLFRSGS